MICYFTFGLDQTGYPGCVEIEGPDADSCREAMYNFTDGRFCGQYENLEKVHPNDRNIRHRLFADEMGGWELRG